MASELGCLLLQTLLFLFLMASLPANMNSLSFNFPNFSEKMDLLDINSVDSKASFSSSLLQLTPFQSNGTQTYTLGRALYKEPVPLWEWDASTKRMADFTTSFNFKISSSDSNFFGDGLAFILVPSNLQFISADSKVKDLATPKGGALGIYPFNESATANHSFAYNAKIVAVEFDTYRNVEFDPSDNHIGIDVNQIKSSAYINVSAGLVNKASLQATITYNSTTKNLSVSLNVSDTPTLYSVSQIIDLSTILPERIKVGFSAATGVGVESHDILAWSFNSSLEETVATSPAQPPQQGGTGNPSTKKGKGGLVAGIAVGISLILILGVVIAWLRLRRKSTNESSTQFDFGEDFDAQAGPKSFAYAELSQATNNFAIERKLGEGGFGGVYKGILTGHGSREIAVKKIKSGSNQGKKEYIAEVKIISRLRHRNLVQLLGWCHDNEELLLVYEFMPNGSLDAHLFRRKVTLLSWPTRYKIAQGLASSLLYLHEEWEQSVVHRDIKSSNVMLDLNFNPKLGDFGLARLVDHDAGLQTTALAGTPGYMAPECFSTGKASKESDVYSFGIVILEIVCGRKVIEVKEEASKENLVEWVWDLYGKGLILDAVDNSLEEEFDEEQAKRLMVVGLWCSHPAVGHRPSIRQAISALNEETPLPSLPPQLPVPIYVTPGMNMSLFSSYTSSNMTEGNNQHTSSSSITTATTSSSQQSGKSTSAAHPLLGTN